MASWLFGKFPLFSNLPNIAQVYLSAPWVFDTIIIVTFYALLFRKLGDKIKLGEKLGTWIGVSIGFITVVYMNIRGQTLAGFGPWFVFLFFIILSVLLYLTLDKLLGEKARWASIGLAVLLAYFLTGFALGNTEVGGFTRHLIGWIWFLIWLSAALIAAGLIFTRLLSGVANRISGPLPAGAPPTGARGLWPRTRNWLFGEPRAPTRDPLDTARDAGTDTDAGIADTEESVDGAGRRADRGAETTEEDITNLTRILELLKSIAEEFVKTGELKDKKITELKKAKKYADGKANFETSFVEDPNALADPWAKNKEDFQKQIAASVLIKNDLSETEAILDTLNPNISKVKEDAKRGEFNARKEEIRKKIRDLEKPEDIAYLRGPAEDMLRSISATPEEIATVVEAHNDLLQKHITNLKNLSKQLKELSEAKGKPPEEIVELIRKCGEYCHVAILSGRLANESHKRFKQFQEELNGKIEAMKTEKKNWEERRIYFTDLIKGARSDIEKLNKDILEAIAAEKEAEPPPVVFELEKIIKTIGEQKAFLETVYEEQEMLIKAFDKAISKGDNISVKEEERTVALAAIMEEAKKEGPLIEREKVQIEEAITEIQNCRKSLALVDREKILPKQKKAIEFLDKNLAKFKEKEDELKEMLINIEAYLTSTTHEIVKASKRKEYLGLKTLRTELNKKLKVLKNIIKYLSSEKVVIKKARVKRMRIEVEGPAEIIVKET